MRWCIDTVANRLALDLLQLTDGAVVPDPRQRAVCWWSHSILEVPQRSRITPTAGTPGPDPVPRWRIHLLRVRPHRGSNRQFPPHHRSRITPVEVFRPRPRRSADHPRRGRRDPDAPLHHDHIGRADRGGLPGQRRPSRHVRPPAEIHDRRLPDHRVRPRIDALTRIGPSTSRLKFPPPHAASPIQGPWPHDR